MSVVDEYGCQDLIGATVGSYKIIEEINRGAMGLLYKGRHEVIGAIAAVKVLRPEFAADVGAVNRFVEEARAQAKVRHPNAVQIFDLTRAPDNRPCIVMELVDGESLEDRVVRCPLPLDQALPILVQICEAVGAAHAADIIHRDVKAENVLLVKREGQGDLVKVIDFSIAKRTHASEVLAAGLTAPGTVLGTPYYMAPEQALGKPLDGRSDVYSVGVLAYRCLTGTFPFEGETAVEVMVKQVRDPAPDLPGFPDCVCTVIHKALEKEADTRYSSMAELALAFRACSRELFGTPELGEATGKFEAAQVSRMGTLPRMEPPRATPGQLPPVPSRPVQQPPRTSPPPLPLSKTPASIHTAPTPAAGRSASQAPARPMPTPPPTPVRQVAKAPISASAPAPARPPPPPPKEIQVRQIVPPTLPLIDLSAVKDAVEEDPPAPGLPATLVEVQQYVEILKSRVSDDFYRFLGLPSESAADDIDSACCRIGSELQRLKLCSDHAHEAGVIELLGYLTKIRKTLGVPEVRATYDAARGNFQGVAQAVVAGLSQDRLQALHLQYLLDKVDKVREAEEQLPAIARAMDRNDRARALSFLHKALALAPFHPELLSRYIEVRRLVVKR